MMHAFRHPWLLLALALACGSKDATTDTETTGDSSSGTTMPVTTVEPTTAEPTSTSTSTGDSTSTSTSDGTTAAPPACETSAEDCGVQVSDVGSFCPDTPPAKDELKLEVLGPGKLRITEIGRDSACNISFNTQVSFGPGNLIIVTYEIIGNPDNSCICKFEVTTTLSNLAPGTYEVQVGSYSQPVDVP